MSGCTAQFTHCRFLLPGCFLLFAASPVLFMALSSSGQDGYLLFPPWSSQHAVESALYITHS